MHRGIGDPPCEACPLANLCLISTDEPANDPLPSGELKLVSSR